MDLCSVVSNSNIKTTNLGIKENQKCHIPEHNDLLYYTPTHRVRLGWVRLGWVRLGLVRDG